MANAAPVQASQAAPAPQAVCWYTYHPEPGWRYC
jgi:hypothetical protein